MSIDAAEHIQAYLDLEGAHRLSDNDVAIGVAAIMHAQGLIDDTNDPQLRRAVAEIEPQVSYYR